MGYKQKMTDRERLNWDSMQYKSMLEARRGHNYQYWNEELQKKIDAGEWILYKDFDGSSMGMSSYSTKSESLANAIAIHFRHKGYYARVICGLEKCVQKIKMYSVVYKKK